MSAASSRRTLVTGAGGFVGANLVRRLLADGHEVVAVTRPGSSEWRLEGVRSDVRELSLDLRDTEAAARAIDSSRPEWVFHLAAHGAYSWQDDPAQIMETNVVATVALVDACRAVGCESFVNAGTSSEYGFKDHPPAEDEVLEPNSAYAVGKVAATLYCRHVARSGGLKASTARLYSVYGPYEEPRRLVPTLIVHGMRGELPPLVGPDVARDFVAADDAVEALLLVALHEGEPGAIFNVGSGTQTSIRELVDVARRTLSIDAEPEWGSAPERSWDTSTWVADTRRTANELGWRPRLGIEDGFARTVEWFRSAPEVPRAYGTGT